MKEIKVIFDEKVFDKLSEIVKKGHNKDKNKSLSF